MGLALPSAAARWLINKRLGDAAWMVGIGIRQGSPEPGKTGDDISIYSYSAGRTEGPVGLEPIIATPTIAVARGYAIGDSEAATRAVRDVQRVNELLHGVSGQTPYGLVVSCFYAREIDAIERDASGKQWQRLGGLFEVTVRSQG